MVTTMGRFCSSECSIINRETKTKLRDGGSKGGGAGKTLLMLLLLLVLGMGAVHLFKGNNPTLNKYDLIGRLLGVRPVSDAEKQKPQPRPQTETPPKR